MPFERQKEIQLRPQLSARLGFQNAKLKRHTGGKQVESVWVCIQTCTQYLDTMYIYST